MLQINQRIDVYRALADFEAIEKGHCYTGTQQNMDAFVWLENGTNRPTPMLYREVKKVGELIIKKVHGN